MPVRFARLRITGFKSFAEPVSVEILPGLTGIVGPNGCGKSNVVEALRWAMGESSARSLRGGEMDDLIFAGTAARPARNLAEVVLTLEEALGFAPPPFHEHHELQISRRIERGAGSFYRVNGRELRARDVQTLFADLASGARSSAMVSQGRVAAIVGARPEERRSILEEAAGITGLHARRHEAELKLRATEGNLVRVEDLRRQLDARVQALSGQSQQAARYREVALQLRTAEALLLALLHARARHAVQVADEARRDAGAVLEAVEPRLARAVADEQAAEAAIPGLRDAEAVARSVAERRRVEAEAAALDGERAVREAEQAAARLQHARRDREEAGARLADARDAATRLEVEREALEAAAAALPIRRDAEAERAARLRATLQAAERDAQEAAEAAASAHTISAEFARDRAAATARLERAHYALSQLDHELQLAKAALPDPAVMQDHDRSCEQAALALDAASHALDTASQAHAVAARVADAARIEAAEATRLHRAAVQALQDAEERLRRQAKDCQTLEQRRQVAESGLLTEAELDAASGSVPAAEAALAEATAALDQTEVARAEAVSARLELAARVQDAGRQRNQTVAAFAQAQAARVRAASQHDMLAREHVEARAAIPPAAQLEAARVDCMKADATLEAAQTRLVDADRAAEAALEAARLAASAFADHREAAARLAAERDGLAQALAADDDADHAGVATLADQLDVPEGLEAALAACLADGLDAALDPDAPRTWLDLPPLSPPLPLPDGVVSLANMLDVPAPLIRALSHVGLIDVANRPDQLQALLQPGQCLVTREGALWRWDGYRVMAGLPSPAARHLQLRSRLRAIRVRLDLVEAAMVPLEQQAMSCAAACDVALAEAQAARAARAPAEQALRAARDEQAGLARLESEARARLDALAPQLERAEAALAEADAATREADAARAALVDAGELAREHGAAALCEAQAVEAEQEARAGRRRAEATLQHVRATAAAQLGRHAESTGSCAALAPLLVRARDEVAAARGAVTLAAEVLAARPAPEAADRARSEAQDRADAASHAEQLAREQRRAAEIRLGACRTEREQAAAAFLEQRSRLEALAARRQSSLHEHDEADGAVRLLAEAGARLADPVAAAAAAAAARDALERARAAEAGAAEARAALGAEQAGLDARREPLQAALADWLSRGIAAAASLEAAEARLAQAIAEQALHEAAPDACAEQLRQREQAARLAEDAAAGAREVLTQAEAALQAAQVARRAAEAGLVAGREAVLRADARQEQAQAMLAQLLAETSEPPDLPGNAAVDLSETTETGLRRRIARLNRERDEIGPVNLRADLELQESEARIAVILHEAEEIETAIAHLRGQIGQLNREGRERLTEVFEAVDRHFQALFARMFNGGRAHLGLVGSDDPLSAGLEIYAQPPGKKLATLSLLSGGEQALTALSLIFAVFRCNPAPVCVLDEVDAPLDDANVERFCALLEDMVRETGTRFLVVTHHQLTMAHMDRLYGVTMQERGVSRVLSVDLARAAEMVGQPG
ncbi:AAA family ATPase [Lichenicola sp.]|uniref:AAA family ATPase n=1 Tax=Lichenicola sp. TaxID=2804529 RepID=UPI003B00CB48